MVFRFDRIISLLIPGCILIHVFLAPYTKVEESFNIQAIHDITSYGFLPHPNGSVIAQHYDHVEFPGAVPRTFVGALLMSALSRPFLQWVASPVGKQLLVRAILGLVNASAMLSLRQVLKRSFGRSTGNWYALLQASQFHIMFYASRTLPNMFALAMTTYALGRYVEATSSPKMTDHSRKRGHIVSLMLLTTAGIIFRSELAVLVAARCLFILLSHRTALTRIIIPAGLVGLVIGFSITVSVDSYFWKHFPIWPEWASFYFNTILGKSSDWGVSPWHFYFSNALPRLLLNPLTYSLLGPLALLSSVPGKRALQIAGPDLLFLSLYSILPHKEWRFIVYVVPSLTAVSAIGASWIWTRRSKTVLYKVLNLALIGSVVATFVASSGLLAISRLNYPGGLAMTRLNTMLASTGNSTISVFADNLACQTGVTRFLEDRKATVSGHSKWRFDKTENQTILHDPLFWNQFDYAIVEHPERCIGKWEVIDVVTAYDGLQIVRPGSALGPDTTTDHLLLDDRREKWQMWNDFGRTMTKFTSGWWITIRMEPKIKILKRQI
ncbi:hypothetical protein BT63DRAFT_450006 [Microthyrium microscopicum]|uniref:Mannosyltransferase n=1 Tax=Microthyrium microscopicum TaxID=703497 RepID=A0A6A6UT86_9PEZI|nr:hypothetical protein BT63DRAFT_450006 [Microthyrium microscopicum]